MTPLRPESLLELRLGDDALLEQAIAQPVRHAEASRVPNGPYGRYDRMRLGCVFQVQFSPARYKCIAVQRLRCVRIV